MNNYLQCSIVGKILITTSVIYIVASATTASFYMQDILTYSINNTHVHVLSKMVVCYGRSAELDIISQDNHEL